MARYSSRLSRVDSLHREQTAIRTTTVGRYGAAGVTRAKQKVPRARGSLPSIVAPPGDVLDTPPPTRELTLPTLPTGTRHVEGRFRGSVGSDLFFQCWLPAGPARAVVPIVHGHGEHSDRYGNVIARLVPAGYAVYGFDLRGHGRSPGHRGHIHRWSEYREDVTALLRLVQEREPGTPRFLLGHSLGGLIVLEYALRHPDGLTGVIASAPALEPTGVGNRRLLALAYVMSVLWPRYSRELGLDRSALVQEALLEDRDDGLAHGRLSARAAVEARRAIRWTKAHAADLRLPLLLIHGGGDRIISPAGSRAFYATVTHADKELHEYPDALHEPHNDVGHEEVIEALRDWLDRHSPGPSADAADRR